MALSFSNFDPSLLEKYGYIGKSTPNTTKEPAPITGAGGETINPWKIYDQFYNKSWANPKPMLDLMNYEIETQNNIWNLTSKYTFNSNTLLNYLNNDLTDDQINSTLDDIGNGRNVSMDLLDRKSLEWDAERYGKAEASREFSRIWYPGAYIVQRIKEWSRGRKYKKNNCENYLKKFAINLTQDEESAPVVAEEMEDSPTPVGLFRHPKVWTIENYLKYKPMLDDLNKALTLMRQPPGGPTA
jgi:hypothetical protein